MKQKIQLAEHLAHRLKVMPFAACEEILDRPLPTEFRKFVTRMKAFPFAEVLLENEAETEYMTWLIAALKEFKS